jgi:hypothetical protein
LGVELLVSFFVKMKMRCDSRRLMGERCGLG